MDARLRGGSARGQWGRGSGEGSALPVRICVRERPVASSACRRPKPVAGGYAVSQVKRKRIEEIFGWLKTVALMRKLRHRGRAVIEWLFTLAVAAYNLVRIRNLTAAVA